MPSTPSRPIMPARLQLEKDNFNIDKRPDLYYEHLILKEMIRRSYITVPSDIRIYNWHDDLSPMKPIDEELRPPTLRQLMTTSYYFAKEIYDRMKLQGLDYLRQHGYNAQKVKNKRLNYEEKTY
eukprot:6302856-Amphidinium_carterae.2